MADEIKTKTVKIDVIFDKNKIEKSIEDVALNVKSKLGKSLNLKEMLSNASFSSVQAVLGAKAKGISSEIQWRENFLKNPRMKEETIRRFTKEIASFNAKLRETKSLLSELNEVDKRSRKSFWGMMEGIRGGYYGSNWRQQLSAISNTGVLNDMLRNEGRRQLIIQGTGLAYRLGGTGAGLGGQVGAALGGTKGLMWGAGVGGLASAIQSATAQAAKYEDALAKTQAIAGITKGTMEDLAASIFKVGSNSRYTNDELIETSTVLAQAGYGGKEISSLLEDVSRLSSATGVDLKSSVDLLTSSMSLWNAQTSDAGKMVDALTVAVNTSKAEISSIQKGMQYAGAAASQLGMSFEETVAAMASVTNAGLKTRSIMGTGLRALLTELTTPTKKLEQELQRIGLTIEDVNVRSKSFIEVMNTLKSAGFGAENAFRALDRQAASFYLAEKSQIDLYEKMTKAMEVRGAAAEAEAKRMNTLTAQWNRLKNEWGATLNLMGEKPLKFVKLLTEASANFLGAVNALYSIKNSKNGDSAYLREKARGEMSSYEQSQSTFYDDISKLYRNEKFRSGDPEEIRKLWRYFNERYSDYVSSVGGEPSSKDEFEKKIKEISGDISEKIKKTERYLGEESGKEDLFVEVSTSQDYLGGLSGRIKEITSSGTPVEQITKFVSELNEISKRVVGVESRNGRSGETLRFLDDAAEASNKINQTVINIIEESLKEMNQAVKEEKGNSKALLRNEWKETSDAMISSLVGHKGILQSILNSVENENSLNLDPKLLENVKKGIRNATEETTKLVDKQLELYIKKAIDDVDSKERKHTRRLQRARVDRESIYGTERSKLENQAMRAYEDFSIATAELSKYVGWGENFENLRKEKNFSELSEEQWNTRLEELRRQRRDAEIRRESALKENDQARFNLAELSLRESQQKNTIRQSRYSSDLSLQLALRNYAAYGADPRLGAVNSIYAAQQRERELKSNRETLDENYKLLIRSPKYTKTYSDAEKQAADAEYRNSVNENSKALLENTQALKEAQEQYDRQHEGLASIKQAGEEFYQSINRNSASYELTMTALNSVSDGLKTTFKDIAINGAKASDAFKAMAQSILQSLAGKAIDKGVDYLMEAAGVGLKMLGAAGSSGGSGGSTSGTTSTGFADSIFSSPSWAPSQGVLTLPSGGSTGGFVSYNGIKKFAVGGTAGKDSVPALLMPGEYVMKKSAVDMLGKDTLDALNNANTKMHKDDKTSGRIQSKSSKPVVTNVYVVSDPKEAGMTPNDVVVAIGRDILQGGQTRQLIQQVVQGAY